MAKLSAFSRDLSKVSSGEEIEVGPEGNTFFITTRGFTPAYRDTLYALRLEAARELNRSQRAGAGFYAPDALPPTTDDVCQGKAIARECVQGVRGLEGTDDQPVSVDDFRGMLESGNYPALTTLAIMAAGRVGSDRAEQAKAAAGN
ncbi:hypothetical protein [Gluconobacter kondonii]|uniref:Uncharacterized protein n=1 Tax=Gluconobacter kondonii TaxID=941463 RepID=A0ABQ5WUQ3_9PROT|nr:hypothetical protein [Gluconobacter kondonii]GBR34890.1 hypothetical protein AA3266_1964 [Gluconobacter kondonii NBRC 3266]GLQ67221.1 hypothetical protein GCM10007870_28060 [Gluconobacter kondonii]